MAKVIELVRILRCSILREQDREMALAALSQAIELWRKNASLGAYQVILSALDSKDDEIRSLAEKFLSRSSPRPCKLGKEARRA